MTIFIGWCGSFYCILFHSYNQRSNRFFFRRFCSLYYFVNWFLFSNCFAWPQNFIQNEIQSSLTHGSHKKIHTNSSGDTNSSQKFCQLTGIFGGYFRYGNSINQHFFSNDFQWKSCPKYTAEQWMGRPMSISVATYSKSKLFTNWRFAPNNTFTAQ